GVEWLQVALMTLALLATMVVSLVAGVFVGAVREHEIRAMLRAALFMLVLCAPFGWMAIGLRLVAEMDLNQRRELAFGKIPRWWHHLLMTLLWLPLVGMMMTEMIHTERMAPVAFTTSPAYLIFLAGQGDIVPFFIQLIALFWLTFVLVELAGIRLVADLTARKDEEAKLDSYVRPNVVEASQGMTTLPPATLQKLATRRARRGPGGVGTRSPIGWLLQPPAWMPRLAWAAVIASTASILVFAFDYTGGGFGGSAGVLMPLLAPLLLFAVVMWPAVYFFVAWQAGRLFAESRRSGSIELLLVTPHFREVAIREQWRSLRSIFLKPGLVFIGLTLVGALLGEFSHQLELSPGNRMFMSRSGGLLDWLLDSIYLVLTFLALAWFSMWRAWTGPRPALAPLEAFLFAVVIPFVLLRLMDGLFLGLSMFGVAGGLGGVISNLLGIAWSAVLIQIARSRLNRSFS
ncbi:MAG TPA: hypothetical protein DCY13_13835, partial [Verrucomicrobiales bacterium]|nr:hypothetical protein [Verrucomicrobiales bacterium]